MDLHLRASPRFELFATDASPSGAGACVAPVTSSLWRTLYNLAEEHGEHVRLSWGSLAPPFELTPSRCAGAALVTPADWSVLFSYRFRHQDHIDVLELTALTSLIKHLGNRGARRQRILCCVDSRVVLGAVSKGRSSSRRLNFCLRKLAFECLGASLSVDLLWLPSWGNPADAPSRGTSLVAWRRTLPIWPEQAPTLQFESAAVARELHLLRKPLPKSAVQKLGACFHPEEEPAAARTPDHWRRLLIDAGDIEPNPGPSRNRNLRHAAGSLLALVVFDEFVALRDVVGCRWLGRHGLLCIAKWTVHNLRSSLPAGALLDQVVNLIADLQS